MLSVPKYFAPWTQVEPATRLAALATLLGRALEVEHGHAHAALPRMVVAFCTMQLKVGNKTLIACIFSLHVDEMSVMIHIYVTHYEWPRAVISQLADFSEALDLHSKIYISLL